MLTPVATALAVCSLVSAVEAPADVDVTIVGDAEAREATRVVVEELLGGGLAAEFRLVPALELRDVVTPPAHPEARLARVWIDLRAPERATIYIVDGPWERIMIRHVPTPEGYGEIPREQVGHITGGAIEAIAGGARIGLEREEAARTLGVEAAPVETAAPPPEPQPEPPATASRSTDLAIWLSASYSAAVFARVPVVTHGPGLGAWVETRRARVRPSFGLTLHYGFPVRVTTPDVTLRLDTVGLRGAVGLGPRVGERVVLRPWLAGGVDFMRVDAQGRRAPTQPFPTFWTPVPIVEAGFGVAIALRRALELRLALAAEVDLVNTVYEFEDTGTAVFDPWVARAGFRVGLAFDPVHWRSTPR